MGITKLLDLISFSYAGISVKSVKNFVNSCLSCKRDTVPSPQLPLTPIIPSFIRERIMVDTIDLSCYSESNLGIKYLFTMIDTFSKFAFVFPSRDKSATSFLNAFKTLYYREGPFKTLHTDNGGEFTATVVTSFINSIGTDTVRGAPYHPQSQGQIERFNRTLKSKLRKFLGETNRTYINDLENIVFQYNTTEHCATKQTLFLLFRRYDLSNPR